MLFAASITVVLLFFCAGIYNGNMDFLAFRYSSEGPGDTWKNKWKLLDGKVIPADKSPWYYFGLLSPEYIERFPYSSTLLVGLTDKWHRNKAIMMACLRTAIVIMASFVYTISSHNIINVLAWIGIWIALMFVQALGFTLRFHRYDKRSKERV